MSGTAESAVPSERSVDLSGTVRLLHTHLTASLCATAWAKERVCERQRDWSLHTLVEFWIAVVLRAPKSLTQILEEREAATSAEGFFQRCRDLSWRFFAEVFHAFVARVATEAAPVYATELAAVRERFAGLWVVDGSRLDAIAHRLKVLWPVRAAVLPGCLWMAYDLCRGVVQRLEFDPDAAHGEAERALAALATIPADTLVVGDRLYAVPKVWMALHARGLWGVCRRNRLVKLVMRGRLSETRLGDGEVTDYLVDAGCGATAPTVRLRLIRVRQGRQTFAVMTNVLDPARLSAAEALALYPQRWAIERVFYDLKEVLNLHRFYAGNPNAVAMQVYASAIVYVAMRVAQGQVAVQAGVAPETLSPEKLFPRVAKASQFLLGADSTLAAVVAMNPTQTLRLPTFLGHPAVTTTLGAITVEPRKGKRRHRRFCASRHRWMSFKHIPGGQKLT